MRSPFRLRRRTGLDAWLAAHRLCWAEEPAPERPGDQRGQRSEHSGRDGLAGVGAEPGGGLAGEALAAVDQRAAARAGVRAGPEEEGPVVDDVAAGEQ